jgi:hypothetical protein
MKFLALLSTNDSLKDPNPEYLIPSETVEFFWLVRFRTKEKWMVQLSYSSRNQIVIMENPAYHAILVRFFRYLDGADYDMDHVFIEDDLRRVTHADVLNFFKFRCFGTPNPDYRDRNLRVAIRVSTVYFWKKGISKFFCNAGVDNKTQGPQITEFVDRIKRMEVRGKGQLSKARVPFKYQDFVHLIQMLKQDVRGGGNDIRKYGIPAMLCFQFSLICRFDDATQMLSANLQHNDRFPQHALNNEMLHGKH